MLSELIKNQEMTIQEESNESDEDSESLASSQRTRHQKDDHQGLSTDAESHRRNRSKQSTRSRLENGNLYPKQITRKQDA